MPSHTSQKISVILPPPAVLRDKKTAEAWFLTRTPGQRQAFMSYVIDTVNGMSPRRKKWLGAILAKQGLSLDMMRRDYPGLNGLGAVMDFVGLATSFYLAKDAQGDAADQSAAGRALQKELADKSNLSSERMNQALIDAKVKAAEIAGNSADRSTELQTYTEILKLNMQADRDNQRREMFGPVWANVIKWGGLGVLVIGGGATFMYMRKKRRR